MDIGQNIKKIRKEKKITLEELSKKTGFSAGYISQVENGKREKPSREFLKSITYGLDVSDTYLTTGKKTLTDLSEDELKKSWEKSQNSFKESRKKFRGEIDNDLKEILSMELGYTEEIFLSAALNFLRNSTGNDLAIITGILKQYNDYNRIYYITEDKEPLLQDIENMKEQIEVLFQTRYGIAVYEKPEKSD
ncbi:MULTISPECIES: helix-turn-helix domain-containing protein [Staphylococcus]|uniref:helix-turn-helix domain-containing protein n=1 Tax=Staphylococcus TaxID=1279 RepID=UPI000267DE77|nr:helix-turn-helix transcriptional regulator [Staphylococcus equorum]MDN5832167.1 helix-turn-helix transcriptional regulator [Tetragenococcus halophilus]MDK9849046.1 helix-turn-helix transcriptional regulator [Staphylococcus equorum]MDK9871991.1 helix-turn-helix transcriptional regulator [Staphylococcus equorum]MDK9876901.1 helix-turn-helix transcriptional regulator [Staphylococcus equorum]MDN6569756.1 helix-turn-helix transcriptional regulator [Staphylococcus equorum]